MLALCFLTVNENYTFWVAPRTYRTSFSWVICQRNFAQPAWQRFDTVICNFPSSITPLMRPQKSSSCQFLPHIGFVCAICLRCFFHRDSLLHVTVATATIKPSWAVLLRSHFLFLLKIQNPQDDQETMTVRQTLMNLWYWKRKLGMWQLLRWFLQIFLHRLITDRRHSKGNIWREQVGLQEEPALWHAQGITR